MEWKGREEMAKHSASIIVGAPADQVYRLFSHFNDFPKFMTCVREVTYYDDQRSHWVADILGHHEWDAINSDWIENRQIGWRSVDGLENSGKVTFDDLGDGRTRVTVTIQYDPPAGVLGDAAEILAAGREFEECLRTDLENFARMGETAPLEQRRAA